jgi:glutathione S-transferase
MALEEKNIPFELQTIDWAVAEHKSPAYLAKQPFGVIPYLDDDGFIIFGNPPLICLTLESRAIVRYLEQKFKGQGTELLPTDLKALGLAEQGAYIESEDFAKPAGALIKETVFSKSLLSLLR